MLGVFVSALLAPAVLAAQGRGKGHGRRGGGEPRFWPGDRTIILDYVGENPGVVSAEGRRLPPGLAKNLRRGKPLPPGWQKKIGAFPTALEQRLSQLPGGYRRVIVDRWALVIAEATNTVMDVIDLLRH